MDAIVRDLKVPARNLRHVSSLVIVASIWSMCASPAEAACDVPGPVCQTYWTYDAVFDGTVLSIERTDSDSEFAIKVGGGDRLVTFEVHRAWKGIDGKRAQLVLAGGFGGYVVSETLDVSIGERYVIFASRDAKGRLTSGGCGPSGRYAHAADALAYLNSLDRPATGGRVFGTVRLSYRQFQMSEVPVVDEPMSALVRLSGPGFSRSVTSHGGAFEFTGLRPGDYTLSVQDLADWAAHEPQRQVRIEHDRGCARESFQYGPTGAIGGFVKDHQGRPVGNVAVSVAREDSWQSNRWPETARTDSTGYYEFRRLPPGRFVVGVNMTNSLDDERPFPRTMYASGGQNPAVIELGQSQKILLEPIHLPSPLREVPLTLLVRWDDGSPVAATEIRIEDVTGAYSRLVLAVNTDEYGRLRAVGRESRKYVAEAILGPATSARIIRSAPFTLTAPAEIRVVLTRPREDRVSRAIRATRSTPKKNPTANLQIGKSQPPIPNLQTINSQLGIGSLRVGSWRLAFGN